VFFTVPSAKANGAQYSLRDSGNKCPGHRTCDPYAWVLVVPSANGPSYNFSLLNFVTDDLCWVSMLQKKWFTKNTCAIDPRFQILDLFSKKIYQASLIKMN